MLMKANKILARVNNYYLTLGISLYAWEEDLSANLNESVSLQLYKPMVQPITSKLFIYENPLKFFENHVPITNEVQMKI